MFKCIQDEIQKMLGDPKKKKKKKYFKFAPNYFVHRVDRIS